MKPPTMSAFSSTRRQLLTAAGGTCLSAWIGTEAAAHGSLGPVQPALATPALAVLGMDGQRTELAALLKGRVTAVQLMFTGCSATCPIQGAIFADVQQQLINEDPRIRLLSVSIDPLGDDVKAMQAWLGKFGARASRWNAALPQLHDVDRLLDFLRGRAPGADRHTAQAFVFDRHARLVFRTEDMPDPAELAGLVKRLSFRS